MAGCGPACPQISAELDDGECAEARAMILPSALPPSRGNAFGDDEGAARFGFFNFYDKSFSRAGDVRCATCHVPEYAFADKLPVAQGVAAGTRNTPTTLSAAHLTSAWFWDGHADSLWSQPLFALESEREMSSTRLELAHHLADDAKLRAGYEAVFGALPDLAALPARGKPGDASFDALSAADQTTVNRIAANVGKAFEAFLRRSASGRGKVDAFLLGDVGAIPPPARRGLVVFLRAGCAKCHSGPLLTDERFHDAQFPSLPGAEVDPGRAAGAVVRAQNPFNLQGPYADPVALPAAPPSDTGEPGAFRTPPLRHVAATAPYGHNGVFAQLSDAIAFHAPSLGAADRASLIAFLAQLEGAYPPPPWNFWPQTQRP